MMRLATLLERQANHTGKSSWPAFRQILQSWTLSTGAMSRTDFQSKWFARNGAEQESRGSFGPSASVNASSSRKEITR